MSRRHLCIPDCQIKKGVPTEHLSWAAEAILEYKPDVIVNLGDFWDMPSLSSYDAPGSKKMEGARYEDDVQSGNDAWRLISDPILKEVNRLKKNKKAQDHLLRMSSLDSEIITLEDSISSIQKSIE
jgi:hypothetical protein